MEIDRAEITQLTRQYGGGWGLNHTLRLLELTEAIGQGLDYDGDVLWVAAHLHDWGAYSPWTIPETDHCLRSCEVAGAFLHGRGYPEERSAHIVECIRLHHAPGADRSLEAILLRDADALDFLGVVGVLRNFALNPRDLRKAYQETVRRRDRSLAILTLDRSRALAAGRVARMNALLAEFEQETCGNF